MPHISRGAISEWEEQDRDSLNNQRTKEDPFRVEVSGHPNDDLGGNRRGDSNRNETDSSLHNSISMEERRSARDQSYHDGTVPKLYLEVGNKLVKDYMGGSELALYGIISVNRIRTDEPPSKWHESRS